MTKRVLLLLIFVIGRVIAVTAQNPKPEADLKAAFIYNFTKYIEWATPLEEDFTIGVIGTSPIYESLMHIAMLKKVNDKPIVVKHFDNPEDIEYCNILFVARNSGYTPITILDKVQRGMLTISEESGFAAQGIAFNFFITNEKLKFEVNTKSINAAGLKASSQLLKLATIIN
ncbi:MAG: YfiR family protein [Ginsengibacter sp.]